MLAQTRSSFLITTQRLDRSLQRPFCYSPIVSNVVVIPESGMKRVLIFVLLGPPCVLGMITALTYIAEGRVVWQNLQHPWMYVFLAMPFLLLCALDALLAAQRVPYRPIFTGLASFALVLILLRNIFAEDFGSFWLLYVCAFSAMPAAVCSWLSSEKQERAI
jgi:hypothetical protein